MLDFSNNDGPVVQSRPSSVYEKKYARNPTRNEYYCNSNKVEPLYEPILPLVPPPLPKKPWENIDPKLSSASEVDKCEKDTQILIHRGPAPLQRSPVIDNVALKAINEERNLKAKEESISDDIVDQLAQISILTQQHLSEQGLISTNPTVNETKQKLNSQDSSTEKLHTLKYKAQTLNTSDTQSYDKKPTIDSSGVIIQNKVDNINDSCSSAGSNKSHISSMPDLDAQAPIKHVHINETLHTYSQEQELQPILIDTYRKISKPSPKSNVSSETSQVISARNAGSDGKEKNDDTSDALKAISSDGEGLPYIDESKGCDHSYDTNIVTGGSTAYGIKQKRILPSVEEENGKIAFC